MAGLQEEQRAEVRARLDAEEAEIALAARAAFYDEAGDLVRRLPDVDGLGGATAVDLVVEGSVSAAAAILQVTMPAPLELTGLTSSGGNGGEAASQAKRKAQSALGIVDAKRPRPVVGASLASAGTTASAIGDG